MIKACEKPLQGAWEPLDVGGNSGDPPGHRRAHRRERSACPRWGREACTAVDRATVCPCPRDKATRKQRWSPQRGLDAREALGAHARRPGRVSGCEGKAAGHRLPNPHRSKERRAKLTPGNYKMFLKETRGDLNEVRDIPCSWTTVLRCPPSPASTRPLSEA